MGVWWMAFDSPPTGKAITALCIKLSLSWTPESPRRQYRYSTHSSDNFDGFFDLLTFHRESRHDMIHDTLSRPHTEDAINVGHTRSHKGKEKSGYVRATVLIQALWKDIQGKVKFNTLFSGISPKRVAKSVSLRGGTEALRLCLKCKNFCIHPLRNGRVRNLRSLCRSCLSKAECFTFEYYTNFIPTLQT